MAEKTTVPVYTVVLDYTDEEVPQPFVAIGPLADGSYAGYLFDMEQFEKALAHFQARSDELVASFDGLPVVEEAIS